MESLKLSSIKSELSAKSQKQLIEICLRLSRFKNENKELVSYLIGYEGREADFRKDCKLEIFETFQTVNTSSVFLAKKTIRKILRSINKYSRISSNSETQIQLLIYFCECINELDIDMNKSQVLANLYFSQIKKARKLIEKLHEDLQYDYTLILERIDK